MSTTQEANRAREAALATLESIKVMVKRLEHECTSEDSCDLTDAEIYEGLDLYHHGHEKASDEEREQYHNQDKAREQIDEDPLSVEVRSGWASLSDKLEPGEYKILLCWGGPAVRIIGDLDNSEPYTARLEYQDWFTPWEELYLDAEGTEILISYARVFPFDL